MTFDIRIPIGALFTALGALIAGYGAAFPARSRVLGADIDLAWGAALLVFGVGLLVAARVGRTRARLSKTNGSPVSLDPNR